MIINPSDIEEKTVVSSNDLQPELLDAFRILLDYRIKEGNCFIKKRNSEYSKRTLHNF